MKKRKSKTKKGRSPSMAAQVKQLTDGVAALAIDMTALKRRIAELENVDALEPSKTEAEPQPL